MISTKVGTKFMTGWKNRINVTDAFFKHITNVKYGQFNIRTVVNELERSLKLLGNLDDEMKSRKGDVHQWLGAATVKFDIA